MADKSVLPPHSRLGWSFIYIVIATSGVVAITVNVRGRYSPPPDGLPLEAPDIDTNAISFAAGTSVGGGAPYHIAPADIEKFDGNKELLRFLDTTVPTTSLHDENLSGILHILRYYGPSMVLDASAGLSQKKVTIIEALTDNRLASLVFGGPILVRTRGGIRFAASLPATKMRAEESHRDQCLAAFAEAKVPLTSVLWIDKNSDAGEDSLEDVLRDSISNFTLTQDELHWTAIAYALYVPHLTSWQNRFGEEYTFDDVAESLLERDLWTSSCGGTHLIYSLAVLDWPAPHLLIQMV